MKAREIKVSQDTITIRGVELAFNGLNENHQKKWQDVGQVVYEKYPGAMDLPVEAAEVENITEEYADKLLKKQIDGTKAFCELFDGVFGDGTSKKLMGDEPYYWLCVEVNAEIHAAIAAQGKAYSSRLSGILSEINPVGPKGKKQ